MLIEEPQGRDMDLIGVPIWLSKWLFVRVRTDCTVLTTAIAFGTKLS